MELSDVRSIFLQELVPKFTYNKQKFCYHSSDFMML